MKNQAFTLIELLVVVLIIGILAAIAVPKYQKAVYKSRYNSLMEITNSIYQAEELYYLANGEYTDDLTALDVSLPCTLSSDRKYCTFDWGECDVVIGNYGKISCNNTSGLNNGYFINLKTHVNGPNKRGCYAYGDGHADEDSKWNKVCKEAGASKRLLISGTCYLGIGNKKCSVWWL